MNGDGPVRVAVIGSGCASVAAAFELTRPEHGGRYQVTIYQTGWRMGGKGASGRGPAGRIEEHGLHVWLGFYENAFRLLRECYAELGRDPASHPCADWRDAFFAAISAIPEIMEVYRMAGEMDYLLRVSVADMPAYDRLYKQLTDTVPLKNVTSHFAMERMKFTTAYPIDTRNR